MPSNNQSRGSQTSEWRRESIKSAGNKGSSTGPAVSESLKITQNGVRGADHPGPGRPNRPRSEMTMYSMKSEDRKSTITGQDQSHSAMETLTEIDDFYEKLINKYEREIKKLNKETKRQQQRISDLEGQKMDLLRRVTDSERAKAVGTSKQTTLENKVYELENRNAELEADFKLITKHYEELNTKYGELQRKERTTDQSLQKAQEKIRQLETASKDKTSRREERLRIKLLNDEKLLHAREQEIEELKQERSLVQRKSINIRDGLSSAKRRDNIR